MINLLGDQFDKIYHVCLFSLRFFWLIPTHKKLGASNPAAVVSMLGPLGIPGGPHPDEAIHPALQGSSQHELIVAVEAKVLTLHRRPPWDFGRRVTCCRGSSPLTNFDSMVKQRNR